MGSRSERACGLVEYSRGKRSEHQQCGKPEKSVEDQGRLECWSGLLKVFLLGNKETKFVSQNFP